MQNDRRDSDLDVRRPTGAGAGSEAPAPLILQTALLGPLTIPAGVAVPAEVAVPAGVASAGILTSTGILEDLSRRAALYSTRARGDGTRRVYRTAWRQFQAWCESLGRTPLPATPDTVAMYVVRRADDGRAVSSLRVDLAAIRTAHLLAGLSIDLRHPRLAMVLDGITRAKGLRPRKQAAPAVPTVLRLMLAARAPADTPLGARDRAMLLLGFGAALRRSELVGLAIGDVEPVPGRGLRVLVRRSKTDQQGKGQDIAIWANPGDPAFCPAAGLDAWMRYRRAGPDMAGAADADRPLFCGLTKTGRLTGQGLSDKAVVRLVKQAAADAGLDPDRYSGHSLRAGLATAAGDNGAGLAALMRQTRHRSTEVALGYLRPADLWRGNVTEAVFQRQVDGHG